MPDEQPRRRKPPPKGARRTPARTDTRPRPAPAHTLRLEVGGRGVELHCDTCDLVVTHLAGPEVRRLVEETHRRHQGKLTWESAWVAECSCGWRTGRLGQDAARAQLASHESTVLRQAAAGRATPPPGSATPPSAGGT